VWRRVVFAALARVHRIDEAAANAMLKPADGAAPTVRAPTDLRTGANGLDRAGIDQADDVARHARRVLDQSSSMMAYWDRDLLCRFANRAYEKWFGVDPDRLIGRSIAELLGPELFAMNETYMRAALGGEPQRFERIVPGPDGVNRHSLATYLPDVVDGEVVGFMVHVTDVTPLKETQAELQATIARLEAEMQRRRTAEEGLLNVEQNLAIALNSVGAGFVCTDREGRVTRMNAVAQSICEWPEAEALGRSLWDVMQRENRPPEMIARNPIDVMLAEQISEDVAREIVSISRTGRRTPLQVHAGLTHASDGSVRGLAILLRDLTQLRRAEDDRLRYVEDLQRSNAELEQYAYIASHDLQEPLRMVANYTELLAQRYQGKLDEKADKYIFYASDGARRMQRLVADLLAYSRVGSQGKPLAPVASALTLQGVLRALSALIRESGATVEYGPLPRVMADEGQLAQLFQNLLGNAIKFRSEAAPRIAVCAERAGEQWRFSVADNGIGIEMQYVDRIFRMFQRLHEIGKYEGSGIGLAVAKRIVERHGGRIWVESQPGVGTTFFFTLPAETGGPR
jgi:PAS domain S-box-containing protein